MPYRIVNGMLICPLPNETGLSGEAIECIVNHTANTMVARARDRIRENTIRGKRAEQAIEQYILEYYANQVCYISYDDIRNDNFTSHAPFDGLFYKPHIPTHTINRFIDEIRQEITQSAPYGKLSVELRNRLVDAGIFTFEIKSSELRDQGQISDYQGVSNENPRTEDDYKAITENILKKWDFFIFPHYCRHVNNGVTIQSFYDYVEYIRANTQNAPNTMGYESFLEPLIREEFDNASEIHTRIYFDPKTNELYIPGYIHKQCFFIGVPTITRMPGGISGSTLYFTRSIEHYRHSFVNLPNDADLWRYNRNAVYPQLYYNHTTEYSCPRCGRSVIQGKWGYYCTNHNQCKMKINKFYGTLDDDIVGELLKGKTARRIDNGRTDIIIPSITHDVYNDSLHYVWKKSQ